MESIVSKSRGKPVLKIRYKKPGGKGFGTRLTLSRNSSKRIKGRILSVKKLSKEEIWRIGDHLPFDPEALLKEFREAEKNKGRYKLNVEESAETTINRTSTSSSRAIGLLQGHRVREPYTSTKEEGSA